MTDKAYIVANKEQELDVLKKFEENGLLWDEGEKPTEWVPSKTAFGPYTFNFPYVLASGDNGNIIWFMVGEIADETIVYDGRKEENMYKVTQEFINALIEWRDDNNLDTKTRLVDTFIDGSDINNFPNILDAWWTDPDNPIENNNRLITIIQWLNGDDSVFKVEVPSKLVIRSEKPNWDGDYWYVRFTEGMEDTTTYLSKASKFDTREEAQEWSNSHQVVIEIDAEGNEVE